MFDGQADVFGFEDNHRFLASFTHAYKGSLLGSALHISGWEG